jgi:hypothetical protein
MVNLIYAQHDFGDVAHQYCQYCDKITPHVLGGDDEWYCRACSPTYFQETYAYFNGRPYDQGQ